ncbi:MAG: potassium/proton antiporter [Thermoanaerobaculia bacterium]
MTDFLDATLLIAGVLLLVSVAASKASGRLGVPALLVFVVIGMLAGSEGPGGIWFNDPVVARALGVIALAYILFAGGLDTDWRVVRESAVPAAALSTLGVLLTALAVAWFAWRIVGLTLLQGFLLGAIVSSTDAAAVFAVLRARGIDLPPRLRGLLELESGSNDPMAVFLTVSAIELLRNPELRWGSLALDFVLQMGIGAVVGILLARFSVWLINRIDLESVGLYPVLTLGIVLAGYGVASRLGGNGFLAVYVAGLVMGQRPFLHKRKIMRFHDGVAWLMQIAMFLVLGLLVFPSQLLPVIPAALATALFLIFVARPLAVMVSLVRSPFPLRERTLVGYVGLRGAVPIILATFPLLAGVAGSQAIFNIVFFIVLTSVLIQGTTIPPAARLLRIAQDAGTITTPLAPRRNSDLVTLAVAAEAPVVGRKIVDLNLPSDTLILLVHRQGGFLVPNGSTVIEPADKLMIFTSKASIERVRDAVERPSAAASE